MVNKNKLDNLSAEEIKEMITAEAIIFESLDSVSLEKLLAYETELLCHGSGDMEFISRCAQRLTAIGDYATKSTKTTSDFASLVDNTITENVTILPAQQTQIKNTQKKKHFSLKHIAIIAAAVLILSTATVGVASAFGVNISEELYKIIRQGDGARKDIDGFTFYNSDTFKNYSSIEEMVESEKLDILYPTMFPDNISIDRVIVSQSERGKTLIEILTNDKNVHLHAEKNVNDIGGSHSGYYKYLHNGVCFYIWDADDSFAWCLTNNIYYTIYANNYDELVLIIDNLKVLED